MKSEQEYPRIGSRTILSQVGRIAPRAPLMTNRVSCLEQSHQFTESHDLKNQMPLVATTLVCFGCLSDFASSDFGFN